MKIVCNCNVQLQAVASFPQEYMISPNNRLSEKSGREIKLNEKGQNMEYKPKRQRSTKDMTRDLGRSTITIHLPVACACNIMYMSNNNHNNAVVQPT